jgi:FkbM family methyltransferase
MHDEHCQPARPAGTGNASPVSGIKRSLLRGACALLSFYFRRVPFTTGKMLVWDRLMRLYIIWRRLDLVARAKFGARFQGALPDTIHCALYFFGVWEPAITAYVSGLLRPGDTVIDIGANVGAHTLLASHLVGPTGKVYAIEASPSIYRRLCVNLEANGVRNVVATNIAVSDKAERVSVYLHEESNLGRTTIVAHVAAKLETTTEAQVEARKLQEIVPREAIRRARLFKIDVEGAEWLVIRGMKELLPELAPDAEILVEVNPAALGHFGASVAGFVTLLRDAGFAAYRMENSYDVSAYINRARPDLQPLLSEDFSLVDIVLRRPGARAGTK